MVRHLYNNLADEMIGEGCHRMKGYECRLACDELAKLRVDFWESKEKDHTNRGLWRIVKSCCETDGRNKKNNYKYILQL